MVVVAVLLAVAGMRLRLIAAGDERWQAIDVVRISRILLTIVVPRLRIARRIGLLLVALIGLRVAWLLVAWRMRLAAELRLLDGKLQALARTSRPLADGVDRLTARLANLRSALARSRVIARRPL